MSDEAQLARVQNGVLDEHDPAARAIGLARSMLTELAANDPCRRERIDALTWRVSCHFCGQAKPPVVVGGWAAQPTHDARCLWVRACEFVGREMSR